MRDRRRARVIPRRPTAASSVFFLSAMVETLEKTLLRYGPRSVAWFAAEFEWTSKMAERI